MRIRSIKPEFWKSDDTAALTDWHDRLVFIGLWSYVDDNGVGRDNENLIRSELFGLEEDTREASTRVRRALEHLAERGLISRYTDDEGRGFFHVTNWHHQKIDRPSAARYPLPTSENVVFDEPSASPRRLLDEGSLRARVGSGIRDQGSGTNGSGTPAPPKSTRATRISKDFSLTDDMRSWAKTHTPTVDLERATAKFIDYWSSKGSNATKTDWVATWRNWVRGEEERSPASRGTQQRPRSTTDERVSGALALADRYAQQEQAHHQHPRLEIGR